MSYFSILTGLIGPLQTTLVFFGLSATLSLMLAVLFCFATRARHRGIRAASQVLIEISRGVPTVVFVLLMGNLGMSQAFAVLEVDGLLPGTPPGFSATAVFVIIGLAYSSAGHLSKIIDASLSTVDSDVLAYIATLKPTATLLAWLLFVEAAPALIQPLSARLTHHLHNTAFISLFPITGLFAAMRQGVDETAQVGEYVIVATALFVLLGGLISLLGKGVQSSVKGRIFGFCG